MRRIKVMLKPLERDAVVRPKQFHFLLAEARIAEARYQG